MKVDVDDKLLEAVKYVESLHHGDTEFELGSESIRKLGDLAEFGYLMYNMIGRPGSGSQVRNPKGFSNVELLLMVCNIIIFLVVGGFLLSRNLGWF